MGQVRNIICFRNDRFGEFLLNIPAFRALKSGFPGAKLFLVVDPYVKELAERIACVDEVILWQNKKHNLWELLKFSAVLKRGKFGLSAAFNPSKEFNLAAFLAGIPLRVGYGRKLGFLLNRKLPDKKYLGDKHEVEYNLELARLAGAETEDKGLALSVDSRLADGLFRDFGLNNADNPVALHPWASDSIKEWPQENFRKLAGSLQAETGARIIIIGGREEYPRSLEFCRNLKACNLTGKTTLLQLAGLLKRCKLLISGDSGPMHLAAAVGTPVIAIFRNDIPGKSPKRWGPWGSGHIVIEKNNLSQITVEEVSAQAKERLRGI
jgi:ADP-heptose:LPS heptosyltransferase